MKNAYENIEPKPDLTRVFADEAIYAGFGCRPGGISALCGG